MIETDPPSPRIAPPTAPGGRPSATPLTLHEKAAELRRTHVLEAATRVFAARGFHRTTIRDIAREAGVADGTIYNVFESKDALLLATLDPMGEAVAAQDLPPEAPEDAAAFVRALFRRRWATFTPAMLDVMRVILSEVPVNEALRALFVERVIRPVLTLAEPPLQRLVEAGRLPPFDVALALRMTTATVLGLLQLRLLGDAEVERRWDEMPDHLAAAFLAAAGVGGHRHAP